MAKHARARVNCLVIGGMHPYARNMEPFRQLFRKGIAEGGDAFVAAVEGAYGAIPPGLRARQLAADFSALLAIAEDWPSLEEILPEIATPCCVYAGDADPLCAGAKQASEAIPKAMFFSLPGLGHLAAGMHSDIVVPEVTRFLRAEG